MSRPLRVSHVITKLAVGGAQVTALAMCEGLDPTRYALVLFSGTEADAEGDLFGEARRRGVEIRPAPELVRSIRPLHDGLAVRSLVRRLRAVGTDVIHTHSSKAGILGRLAARQLGVPAVHSVHGWSFNDRQSPAVRFSFIAVERLAARWTDAFVVVTPTDCAKGVVHGIGRTDRYHLIRSGIDLDGLHADVDAGRRIRAELAIAPNTPLVGTIGRLADQKDPLAMVAMMAELRRRGIDAHFAWVGDGPLRPDAEKAVADAGLVDRFHFLGVRRDVSALLSSFDVFALSSLWEGLPRTVTEAMAVGTPVAATAVDGCAEIIIDGTNGLLVPPARPDALAGAVARLVTDRALARSVSEAARVRVQAWDRRTMLDEIAALYDSLDSRRSPAPLDIAPARSRRG